MVAVCLGTFLKGVLWSDMLGEHSVGIAVAQGSRGQGSGVPLDLKVQSISLTSSKTHFVACAIDGGFVTIGSGF